MPHDRTARSLPRAAVPTATNARLAKTEDSGLRQTKGVSPGQLLRCPRCHKALARASVHDELVDACQHCDGLFVPHDVLARMVKAAHATESPNEEPRPALDRDVRYLGCPRCGETMQRMNFGTRSGIIVDVCRAHGTWFDRGEIEAVLDYVSNGGLATEPLGHTESAEQAAPTGEAARMVIAAQSLMHVEAMHDAARVAVATDFVDDLLWVVFPGDRSFFWRERRRL